MHSSHPEHRHGDHGHAQACGHAHGHAHLLPDGGLDRAMAIGVGLNTLFVVAEIVCGFFAGSLALVADAGHNAGDVIGLLLAWGASWLARRPPSERYTWGFRRTTIYAALANAVLLLTACGAILWEAAHRLRTPEPVAGLLVIAVATIGVVINTATVAGTWGLFRESIDLALDAVPRGIETGAITTALAAIPGVEEVHDLHVWGASTSEVSLTVHLVVPDGTAHETVLPAAEALLRERFHIDHTTIQLERAAAGRACVQRPAGTL